MSPTLNFRKTSDRKIDFPLNINNNLFLNNNLVFNAMPDLQPILDFDGSEDTDEVDGNSVSGDNQSSNGHRDNGRKPKTSKKKEFKVTAALMQKQAPAFLLIESLIWNICCTDEKDPQKQRLLFNNLCQRLNSLKLIGSSYTSASLHPIREYIVKKFKDLIVNIRTNDKRLFTTCNPISNTIIYNSPHLIHQSRYRDDFEDMGLIEAGGFGVVNKAKYRFDDCEYAVKMIRFKYNDKYEEVFKKIIREVQLYANLSSHPNVVAYKTAWLENWCLHRQSLPFTNQLNSSGDNQILNPSSDELYAMNRTSKDSVNDVSIRFEESSKSGIRIEPSDQQIKQTVGSNPKLESKESTDDSDDEESSSDEDSSSDSDVSNQTFRMQSLSDLSSIRPTNIRRKKTVSMCSTQSQSDSAVEYRDCFELQSYHKQNIPDIKINDFTGDDCPFACSNFGAILYIQMELCGKNLKTWLRERNEEAFAKLAEYKSKNKSSPKNVIDFVDKTEAKNIFRQVLKGVEYIHSQHLIHRDLKPQNILFSADGSKVKIGDFGLATLHNSIIDSEVISIDLFKPSTSSAGQQSTADNDLNHTGNIGTSIYASPEQKCRKDYDHKTDLFSLGIILFELFYPLSTEMEKVKCVSNITKNQVLPKILLKSCPKVASIIQSLTNPNPVLRPNASDLLHSSLFLTDEQLFIKQIEDQNKRLISEVMAKEIRIKELENSLDVQKRIDAEKDQQIENLTKQLELINQKLKFFF